MTDTKTDDFMAFMEMVKEESTKDTEVEKKLNLIAKAVPSQTEAKTEVKVEKKSHEPFILEEDTVKEEKDVKTEATTTEPEKEAETKDEEQKAKEPVPDPTLDEFYSEIDNITSEAFKSSSKAELDRLLRPGSTYFNLNPFEVLQIDPYCSLEEIRKKYRKLSIYVHPDKNPNDKERADIAFEAVNRAYKMLDDEKERKKCLEVVEEAMERVNKTCEEKRKKLRKEAIAAAALAAEQEKNSRNKSHKEKPEAKVVSTAIEEDDPDKYRHAIYVMTCKLFADIERLKVREREKQAEEKKRKAEEKELNEANSKKSKEWQSNYEESRQSRVSSWQNFAKKPAGQSTQAKAKPAGFFRPPKYKPETR